MATLFRGRQRACPVCGTVFHAARSDARYCSGKCRMRILRKLSSPEGVAATNGAAALARMNPRPLPAPAREAVAKTVTDDPPAAAASVTPRGVGRTSGTPKKPPALGQSAKAQLARARASGKKVVKIVSKPKGRAK